MYNNKHAKPLLKLLMPTFTRGRGDSGQYISQLCKVVDVEVCVWDGGKKGAVHVCSNAQRDDWDSCRPHCLHYKMDVNFDKTHNEVQELLKDVGIFILSIFYCKALLKNSFYIADTLLKCCAIRRSTW